MPLWKDSSLFDSLSMNVSHDEPEASCDAEKRDDEGVSKATKVDDQERPENSTPNINTVGPSINTASAILELVIGDIHLEYKTRDMTQKLQINKAYSAIYVLETYDRNLNTCMFFCFLSQEEPKRVTKALSDSSWVEAMQEELLQFKLQEVWVLVDLPKGKGPLGYTQEEGIDYDEVFSPVGRIEAIRLFLAYASFMGFKVYQMDVKSAFLYGQIEEEVYVCQPPGFKDPDYPDKVYKVVKALYGLHQAPRA
ncbi:putative ribonuclease H-like domain-containing protein [Tanacetum coccineum]